MNHEVTTLLLYTNDKSDQNKFEIPWVSSQAKVRGYSLLIDGKV